MTEKHMGSRAVVLVARDPARFGAPDGWRGVILSRTGRPFFESEVEAQMLGRLYDALADAGAWDELGGDRVLLDGEMLPSSIRRASSSET